MSNVHPEKNKESSQIKMYESESKQLLNSKERPGERPTYREKESPNKNNKKIDLSKKKRKIKTLRILFSGNSPEKIEEQFINGKIKNNTEPMGKWDIQTYRGQI